MTRQGAAGLAVLDVIEQENLQQNALDDVLRCFVRL